VRSFCCFRFASKTLRDVRLARAQSITAVAAQSPSLTRRDARRVRLGFPWCHACLGFVRPQNENAPKNLGGVSRLRPFHPSSYVLIVTPSVDVQVCFESRIPVRWLWWPTRLYTRNARVARRLAFRLGFRFGHVCILVPVVRAKPYCRNKKSSASATPVALPVTRTKRVRG